MATCFITGIRVKVIEDDTYFLTVLGYIYQNPIRAGLVKDMSHYKWSSYIAFIEGSEQRLVNVDREKSYFKSQDKFIEFMKLPNSDQCLESEVKIKYTDEKLTKEILKI